MRAGFLAAVLAASYAAASGAPVVGQRATGTGDPLLDYKLRSSRAVQAHKELERKADELRTLAAGLANRVGGGGALGAGDAKTLDRIHKLAKQVRAQMGGTGDPQLADPPRTLRDAAAALGDRGEAFADRVHKSTRFEMNAKLVVLAGEIMLLSDLIKQFGE